MAMQLTPFFGQQRQPAPFQQPAPQQAQGADPRLLLGLGGFARGFLEGGQRGGLGAALLGGAAGGLPGIAQGQQIQDQQARQQAVLQQQEQQARQKAALEAAKQQEQRRQFGITTGLKQQTENRLLTKDQRDAQDLAFRQNNAVQKLQLDQAKFRLDQATSAPEKIQIMQAMGLDPASPEGRELLTASLTKPQVQINQPKLSPGQIPIDPNDLSKGSVAAKDIGQARVTAANVGATLDRYQQALQESGAETLPGPARDKLKNARTQLLLELKTLNELGAITGPDLDLMNDLVIDPTSFNARVGNAFGALAGNSLGERALANIDVLRQQVSDRLNAITGQVGAPAVPQAAQQATPADLSQMSTEQLLQLQGSLSAGNP